MSKRKRRRSGLTGQYDRMQQAKALLIQMRGTARKNNGELIREPPPVTLPALKVLTLAEIEQKYGDIDAYARTE